MDRRSVLRLTAGVVTLGGCATASAVLMPSLSLQKAPKLPRALLEDVSFTNGVHSARLPDGTWNLWVRAAPQGKNRRAQVKLRLDVATDEKFSQIILRQSISALNHKSYIVRMQVRPKISNNLLFFRFVVTDTPIAFLASNGFLNSQNFTAHSRSGKLDPWEQHAEPFQMPQNFASDKMNKYSSWPPK
ncbi:hypothetical protein ABT364_05570 [Massilia sp. SR12]